jgi:hypothetical protein
MQRDLKEIVGILMRVLSGGEVSHAEVTDLGFEAEGELHEALNEAYIKLLEFAHDDDLRRSDKDLDQKARAGLQDCLYKIIDICDRQPGLGENSIGEGDVGF